MPFCQLHLTQPLVPVISSLVVRKVCLGGRVACPLHVITSCLRGAVWWHVGFSLHVEPDCQLLFHLHPLPSGLSEGLFGLQDRAGWKPPAMSHRESLLPGFSTAETPMVASILHWSSPTVPSYHRPGSDQTPVAPGGLCFNWLIIEFCGPKWTVFGRGKGFR